MQIFSNEKSQKEISLQIVAKKQIKSGLPYKTLKAFIDFTLCEITA